MLLLAAALGLARAAGPVFKQEAAEEMRVEHRTSIRGGETVHDYTKLEVEARLLDMLEDPSVVVKDRVLVEHKDSQQQDWAEVAAAPSLRGGVYRWTIADTVPCRDHSVRLTVFGEDGSRNTFYYPHTIVAPRLADIAVSGYRPATPGPVQQGVRGDGSMVLSWAEAAYIDTRSGGEAARPRQLPGVRGLGDGGAVQRGQAWRPRSPQSVDRGPDSDDGLGGRGVWRAVQPLQETPGLGLLDH